MREAWIDALARGRHKVRLHPAKPRRSQEIKEPIGLRLNGGQDGRPTASKLFTRLCQFGRFFATLDRRWIYRLIYRLIAVGSTAFPVNKRLLTSLTVF